MQFREDSRTAGFIEDPDLVAQLKAGGDLYVTFFKGPYVGCVGRIENKHFGWDGKPNPNYPDKVIDPRFINTVWYDVCQDNPTVTVLFLDSVRVVPLYNRAHANLRFILGSAPLTRREKTA